MKQVEQEKLSWADELGEKLHSLLDYRANVIIRDRVTQESFTKVEAKKARTDKNPGGASKDRIFYCLEFNQGTCPHGDHHEGIWGNKKIMKFHFCRKCHKEGDYRSHKETDDVCPKKRAGLERRYSLQKTQENKKTRNNKNEEEEQTNEESKETQNEENSEEQNEEITNMDPGFNIQDYLDVENMTEEEIDRCEFWITANRLCRESVITKEKGSRSIMTGIWVP